MRVAAWMGAGVLAALLPSAAGAAPIELSRKLDGVWVFDDVDGTVEDANWFERDGFFAGYDPIEAGFFAVHPDDSQFLVIYTTWTLPVGIGALYQAVANDVEGIGYGHIAELDPVIPSPMFDDTPGSQVQGFLHLNRWTNYVGADDGLDDATISLIFGQEFGHAWLAFPWYLDASGQIRDDMLGRSDAHWSFYLHTGGSPVQGHDWVDNGDGTFTAHTHDIFEFSDLDLYLMGLLPASDVEPFFLLTDPTHCIDSALEDGSCAPHDAFAFEAETYTVTADRQDITIDQILDAEGPRIPAYGVAPTQWDVSFLLIKRPDEELPADQLQRLQQIVARSIELFDAQTRGLGHIINRTAGEMDPLPPPAGGSDSGSGDGSGDGDGDDSDPDPDPSGGSSAGAAFPGGSGSSYPHNDDDGCSCRTGAPPAAWWALAVLGLARRRRRH